jgi:hypothetical protein
MMTTTTHGTSDLNALRLSRERPAAAHSGYLMVLVLLVAFLATLAGPFLLAAGAQVPGFLVLILGAVACLVVGPGFYLLQPNQAAACFCSATIRGATAPPACAGAGRG